MFLGLSLASLTFACTEHQWKERRLNELHIFNEAAVYVFCLFLLYFSSSEASYSGRIAVGYCFIGLFILWLMLNLCAVLMQSLNFIKLLLKRSYYQANIQRVQQSIREVKERLRGSSSSVLLLPSSFVSCTSGSAANQQK